MGKISSVCVYCGARAGVGPRYAEAARAMGRGLAERGMTLIYGGGRIGLMGEVADAALAGGGRVVGIIPEHLETAEVGHQGVAELLIVDSMHERKAMMAEQADAFVVLPGGLGTLDETFEIMTWRQLGLHDKPIIVANIGGYWSDLHKLVGWVVGEGFANASDGGLLTFVDDIPAVFAALEAAPKPSRPVDRGRL